MRTKRCPNCQRRWNGAYCWECGQGFCLECGLPNYTCECRKPRPSKERSER